MKKLLFLLILISTPCKSQSLYIDTALNDVCTNSIFISINIDSKHYTGKAIIENADLFRFVYQNTKCSFSEYTIKIKEILLKSDTMLISKENLDEIGFQKIEKSTFYLKYDTLNKIAFVNNFFLNNTILKKVSEEEKAYVIDRLFSFGILVRNDDESGYLTLINYRQ